MQESPDRYQELLDAADKKYEFWKALATCFTSLTNYTIGQKNCKGPENETILNRALMKLSEYDIFVLEKLLSINDGNMSSDILRGGLDIGHYYSTDPEHLSNLVLQQDMFVEEFCQNGLRCDAQQIDRELKNIESQITFLLKG